jgi:type II secretory pathway pseudopilin PulG
VFDRTVRRHGFALVELLLATSLMALAGGAAVASLAGGLQVWGRAREMGTAQQAALITLEQLRRDLQNIRPFRPIPFEGRYDRVEFAAAERPDDDPEAPGELGRLGYFHDGRRRTLCRSFTPYPQTRRRRLQDHCQVVLEGVSRVRFSYLGSAPTAGGAGGWQSSWEEATPPLAVRAEVSLQAAHREPSTHTTVIHLTGARRADEDE